jgi:hypothetical protein
MATDTLSVDVTSPVETQMETDCFFGGRGEEKPIVYIEGR